MADQSKEASSQQSTRNRVVNSVTDKAQQIIKEDFSQASGVARDAAKSRAYLYPIKGIFYFATHRDLWKPFYAHIGPFLTLSLSVAAGMFAFTYLPQLAVLVLVNGPLAVVSTVFLVLNESAAITNLVSRTWLLQDALLDIFDGTLIARNATSTVKEGREIKPGSNPSQKLGKILKSPLNKFGPKALVRYVMYLPLNFIPVAGNAIFIFLQGRNRGQSVHDRYFQLRNWSASQRSDWLEKHAGPYTAFGLVATLLEMVPIASIFFTYTNTVGAALWAADIESMNTSMTDGTAPALRESADKLE